VTDPTNDKAAWLSAEAALSEAPLVAEAALVPRPDGGRPWLVARPDETALRAGRFVNVREAVRFRLETAAVALPIRLRHRGVTIARKPLPRLGDGALDREKLREIVGCEPPAMWPGPAPVVDPPADLLKELLIRAGLDPTAAAGLDRQHSLEFDLGLDSLDRMALILSLGGLTGVNVGDDTVTRVYSVEDLEREFLHSVAADPVRPFPGGAAWRTTVLRGPSEVRVRDRWLRPPIFTWPVVRVARALVWPLVRRRLGVTVRGLDRVDWERRPLMIAQNHQTHMDAAVLAGSLPARVHRQVMFLGFTGYFARGWGRWIGETFCIHPISADEGALTGLRAGLAAIESGRIVCVYPEGERTWDGTLRPFRRGVAWLAAESGSAVVPSAIVGAYRSWPRGRPFRHNGSITVLFGAPLEPPGRESGPQGEAEFLNRLRAAIADLLREGGHDPELGEPEVWAHGPGGSVAR
jgi:1-acyl-sn-glycerol-3-phosphate acyltransferase/acyl carrier protein